jgi:hypothetical protein
LRLLGAALDAYTQSLDKFVCFQEAGKVYLLLGILTENHRLGTIDGAQDLFIIKLYENSRRQALFWHKQDKLELVHPLLSQEDGALVLLFIFR